MNYKIVVRINAKILLIEAAFMVPALLISFYCKEELAAAAFGKSILAIAAAVAVLLLLSRGAKRVFYAREGFVCVGLAWIIMSAFGCLPFYLSGEIPHYIDALFEMVSGFTTTGASIVPDVEKLSKGILYWRSFSHWIGGMGVLVFLLAIAPSDKKSGGFSLHLLRAESPGPSVGKIVPKMRQTAMILYVMYVALTMLDVIFLMSGGMSPFESFCHAFGTAGTGGFGVKSDSFAGYSPYLQNVTTVFMILFGVNFTCYYLLLTKQFSAVLFDEELRLYIGTIIVSTVLISLDVGKMYGSLEETLRTVAFQVGSIITTTGYATADFDKWPSFSKSIILFLMIMGACAGSTGGGMKCSRALILFKTLRRNIHQLLHPQRVQVVRINNRTVSETVLANTNSYLAAYVMIIAASVLIVSMDGFSFEANFSAVLCTFNNIGPGLAEVGPTCNFSAYGVLSKCVLILGMLLGRLEIFPILVLFSGSTWHWGLKRRGN
ncbi:TrkH family potassium uptake protein [Lachnospiraceae bacterium C1.1]|nr:TrkH family potassium uptake protein [Lachnospiraceae bacterium C1.1]